MKVIIQQEDRTRKEWRIKGYGTIWTIWMIYRQKKLEESWNWLRHGNLKRETESLVSVAQKKPLNSTSIRKIYHKDVSDKCKLSGSHVETALHSVYGCNALAQKDYKRRHKLCWNINWAMYKILKILWDVWIQVVRQIKHWRPDIAVMDNKKCLITDVA